MEKSELLRNFIQILALFATNYYTVNLSNSEIVPKNVLFIQVRNKKNTKQGVKLKMIIGMTRHK